MAKLYPLRFRPILRRYIWGGRRLESVLGKSLGPGDDYAESWEICDHGPDQSVVESGPLEGSTLAELVARHGEELLGRHYPQPHFPLLMKFLDAAKTLSVQVHPDDARAAQLDPTDLGKTEAWVVLATEPGSIIYAGLKPGIDRQTLAAAISAGECQECLHQLQPEPGDCIHLTAGTVHALGAGILVAEIQQASDTTYRLFDWNRVGADGKPRQLHVEQGLEAIDWQRGPIRPQVPQSTDRPSVSRLVSCDKFTLDRWEIDSTQSLDVDRRCHILTVVVGSVRIESQTGEETLTVGQTVLSPASLGGVQLCPAGKSVLLDAFLP